MRKTRIAFFAETLERNIDGAVRTMFQIIDRIPTDQFEFLFFTATPPKGYNKTDHNFSVLESLPLPFNQKYRFVNIITQKPRINRELKWFRPDIIHIASPSMMGRAAAEYGNKYDIPVLSIYHTHFSSYINYYSQNLPIITELASSYIDHKLRAFYNRCSKVLAPTETIKKYLIEQKINEKCIDIWARGIDASLFSAKKRDESFIQQITGNKKKSVLFVSRLVWEKNLRLLADLHAYNTAKGDNYNFIIVGDGPAREVLESHMPGAFFLGKKDHHFLSTLYASADYFVFPSISETYGNVLLEALASGLPCIAANGGANTDIIKHGTNGFLCDINNYIDYYDKIQLLETQPTLTSLINENSIQFAHDCNWDRLVADYFDLLSNMANHRKKYIRMHPKMQSDIKRTPELLAI